MELIEGFRLAVNKNIQTKSGNVEKLIVESIEDQIISIDIPSNALQTKAGDSEFVNGKTSVKLETVFFKSNGEDGFAIASSDPRINRVYAFTEKGSITDTVFNAGLAATLYNIPLIVKQDIESYYTQEKAETVATKADPYMIVTIGPLANTAWDQDAPYNKNLAPCPNGSNGGHVLTGCGATSVAQVIAYYNYPADYSNWYNLSVLRTQRSIYAGHPQENNVAELMRVVALGIKSDFGCSATGSLMYDIHVYFNNLGYYNLLRKRNANVDLTTLYRNLRRGNIHLTSGFTKKPRVGHGWIWDGIYCMANSTSIQQFYSLHCNWGWGGRCDGWYANFETPNDGSNRTYLDDNSQLYISMY
jgi:hypothetical protein